MQVVLIHLQPVGRSSVLNCVPQPEIAQKITKTLTLGFQGRSRSSMLIALERSSPGLVMITDKQHIHTYLQLFSRYTSQKR